MRVAEVRPEPRRSYVRTSQRTRSMTRAPRPTPPGERPLTASDIERLTDKLGGKIDGSEDRINDKLAEAKAQGRCTTGHQP